MRRWIRLASRLYPRSWRERYGAEFDALLDQTSPRARDFFDVLGSALLMQLTGPGARVALLGAAIGTAIAVVLSFAAPRQYEAHAAVRIEGPAPVTSERFEEQLVIVKFDSYLAGVMGSSNLYAEERRKGVKLSLLAERMKREIRVTPTSSPAGFDIAFTYPDEARARRVIQRLSDDLVKYSANRGEGQLYIRKGLQRSLPNTPIPSLDSSVLVPVDRARTRPLGRNWPTYAGIGLAAGLLLGAIVSFTRRQPRVAFRLAAFAAAGAALGIAVALALPTRYTASSFVRIAPPTVPLVPYDIAALTAEFRQLEKQILVEHKLDAPRLPAADIWRGDVRVNLIQEPFGFTVNYTGNDPAFAMKALNQLTTSFAMAQSDHYRRAVAESPEASFIKRNLLGVRYLTMGFSLGPATPGPLRRVLISLAGVGLGLIASAIFHRRRPLLEVQPA